MQTWGLVKLPETRDEYLDWLRANPRGYVVNDWKNPVGKPADTVGMRWHRADCKSIATDDGRPMVGGDTLKACSTDVSALAAWTVLRMYEYGEALDLCTNCRDRWLAEQASTAPAERVAFDS